MSPPRARLARAFSSPASNSLCFHHYVSPLLAIQHFSFRIRKPGLKCSSSCRRVRSPDPWASVGYEAFQDAGVEAGCDVPAPPARAIQLEEPPLADFGHGRLFEGSQAARRQRPHVDLLLGFACGDERGIGPEGAPPLARFSLCLSAHLRSPSLPIVCQPSSLRCSSTLFALCEGVLLGLHWQRLPPHRAAYRALERVVIVEGAAPAAGREVLLVDDFLAEGSDPGCPAHYAALPERRPIHSLASSRVSSPTGFPTISSKRPIPSSTTSAMRASR